ncbi:unnamed protein product [Lasius platythorax]|uniref:RNase H type-1 domain-containing protein n=1 Tax=Lasius platythorax TaxID=488582 RepID=A0AAV2NQC0_9HYME
MASVLSQPNHPIRYFLDEWENCFLGATQDIRDKNVLILQTYINLKMETERIERNQIPICYSVSFESTTFVPEVDLSSGLNFDKEANCESLFYDFFETEIKETICIYTDGSKTQNSDFAGYAVVTLNENIRLMKRTPNCLSIFTLEALAVRDALTLIEERDLRHVTIFSDSKSVLSAIKNFPSGSRTLSVIYKIKDKLKNMKESGFEVKMIWIPSHCNIIGNELADARAKAATHQGDEWDGEIPLGDIKSGMKNSLFNKFYEWCEITGKERGTFYFNNYFNKNRKIWFRDVDIPRKAVVSLCRLRCGHTSLRDSLARFNIVSSPVCQSCETNESANHVFWQCPRFDRQRKNLIKEITLSRGFLPHPIESLLVNINREISRCLSDFIVNIDICI